MYRNRQCVCYINVTNRSGSSRVGGKAENQLDVIKKLLFNHLTETDACPVITIADGRLKELFGIFL